MKIGKRGGDKVALDSHEPAKSESLYVMKLLTHWLGSAALLNFERVCSLRAPRRRNSKQQVCRWHIINSQQLCSDATGPVDPPTDRTMGLLVERQRIKIYANSARIEIQLGLLCECDPAGQNDALQILVGFLPEWHPMHSALRLDVCIMQPSSSNVYFHPVARFNSIFLARPHTRLQLHKYLFRPADNSVTLICRVHTNCKINIRSWIQDGKHGKSGNIVQTSFVSSMWPARMSSLNSKSRVTIFENCVEIS